jgi:hypothetical protein
MSGSSCFLANDSLLEKLVRDGLFGQLLDASRMVGELETKLLQLKLGREGLLE